MKTPASHRSATGFSLIEVLIAVVVFSFGVLALTALQGALFKASAEAKAQSAALGLANDKLEELRGFKTITEYKGYTDSNDSPALAGGGVTYTREWTVERYAFPKAGGDFEEVSDTGDLSADYVANNEFKRLVVTVRWTDAEGNPQHVTLEDAISALDPADSAKQSRTSTNIVRGPIVNIHDPTTEGGVIPIAVGDDTDTAATNPKPVTTGNSNNARVIETRFDTYTYTGADGATAQATSRVETALVGCTCNYGTASSTAVAKRPTYWNGARYVVPADASYAAPAGEANLANNAAQSSLCTACCRDHHDPVGVTGAKFDPRNTSHSSGHYLLDSAGVRGSVTTSGEYTEACRVIRVDGFFRVAADMYDDYFNLLETKNGTVASTAYLPKAAGDTPNATANYQAFVLDYLNARNVTAASSSWNNAPSGVSTLETTHSINSPALLTLDSSNPYKWLHSRGLFVDYLEDEAIQAISDAKNDCKDANNDGTVSANEKRDCVLKVLPFTSINLTELSDWTPASSTDAGGTQIVVANGEFKNSTDTSPVRGKTTPGSNPSSSITTNAIATMRRSNSGMTTQLAGIDPDDASTWNDSQPFKASSNINTGGSFSLNFSNYTFGETTSSYPQFSGVTCNYATTGGSKPNPFSCTASSFTNVMLTIGHYNVQESVKKTTLNCSGESSTTHTFGGQGKTINVCKNYRIDSISGTGSSVGAVSNDGLIAESTVLYPVIAAGQTLTVNMVLDSSTDSYTCTWDGSGNNDNDYTVTPVTCP